MTEINSNGRNNIDSLINIETFEKIEKSFKYFSEYKITQNNMDINFESSN